MSLDTPVQAGERLDYMDVLRGFAVMAIFIVNIKAMFAPYPYYMNSTLWGGENDQLVAQLQAIFVDHRWRTIFTGLFGAGLILVYEKAIAAGSNGIARLRARLIWLLIFGLIHLLAIWYGDILTMYALTGFIMLAFISKPTKALFNWALLFLFLGFAWMGMSSAPLAFLPASWLDMIGADMWGTDADVLLNEVTGYTGGIADQFMVRAPFGLMSLIGGYALGGLWAVTLGIMLMGVVLFKSGFLKGEWSIGSYFVNALLGLGIAFGASAFLHGYLDNNDWTVKAFLIAATPMMMTGLPGAYGYAALIGLLMKLGLKFSPVAAAGRMAFTNYIASSLIGTTLAYGHGFGLYGQLNLQQLMYIVGATFLAMLIWSPLWLSVFRFGPLEWLWRSLTYGRLQPLLK